MLSISDISRNMSTTKFIEVQKPVLWIKNLLVLYPLFFISIPKAAMTSYAVAIVSFCLASGLTYIINDIFDAKEDRFHPRKKHRAIASNKFSKVEIITLLIVQLCFLLMISAFNTTILYCVIVYLLLSATYTLVLRKIFFVDLIAILALHLMRVATGILLIPKDAYSLIGVEPIVFISLAIIGMTAEKRISDCLEIQEGKSLRPYLKKHISILGVIIGACIIAYFVLLLNWMGYENRIESEWMIISIFSILLWVTSPLEKKGNTSSFFTSTISTSNFWVFVCAAQLLAFSAIL